MLYITIEARTNPSEYCYADHTIFYELDSTGGIKSPKVVKGIMKVPTTVAKQPKS